MIAPSSPCPISLLDYPVVSLAHGGGGKRMQELISKMFLAAFGGPNDGERHDSAVLESSSRRLAFTTDSFVVSPLFFPGGDIGSLAVNGTVNDLAMSGAKPLGLSAAFIIEEGFSMEELWRIVCSMADAAKKAGVSIVTGDTKVVDKGKGDGIFITTAGVGAIGHALEICPKSMAQGDAVLVSGDVGKHGAAIMSVRKGLEFESSIESDCKPLNETVGALLRAGVEIHCMRDLTRGGLSSALVELAIESKKHVQIAEGDVVVAEDVAAVCEVLGLDPFFMANEGRFVLVVPKKDAVKALEILQSFEPDARAIGVVNASDRGIATLRTPFGAERIIDLLSGEQLPRIC